MQRSVLGHLLDLDGLGLEVVVQSLQSTLTAVTALLDATEGRVDAREVPVVDGDGAGLDLASDAEGTGDVVGVHAS